MPESPPRCRDEGDQSEKRGDSSEGFVEESKEPPDDNRVVIKRIPIDSTRSSNGIKELLEKRMPTWKKISHQNVLPLREASIGAFQLNLVYDREQNGNINQYLSSHPQTPRLSLLLNVAEGLEYLHSLNIPHGNLRGTNVLIDQKGQAVLTEYGLAPIIFGPSFTTDATIDDVRNSRWLAPELMHSSQTGDIPQVTESKPADVFAFSMLAMEVFTGKPPFGGQRDEAVMLQILRGDRPKMPERANALGITCEMWELLNMCWRSNPGERPTMREIARSWRVFIGDEVTTLEPLKVTATTASISTRSEAGLPQSMSPAQLVPKRPRRFFCGLF